MPRNCQDNGTRCYRPVCPLEDAGFWADLDRWMYAGRAAVSVNFERGGRPDNSAAERGSVDKAAIYVLFADPEAVQRYWTDGGMSRRLCDVITEGYLRWRRKKVLTDRF